MFGAGLKQATDILQWCHETSNVGCKAMKNSVLLCHCLVGYNFALSSCMFSFDGCKYLFKTMSASDLPRIKPFL